MSEPVKLLFDECLGKPLLEDIKRLLAWDIPPPVIEHLLDFFNSGTCDSVWIPKVANEGWIILTADRGKKSSHMKLPSICEAYKITHILMSASVLNLKQSQKANAIVAVWEEIKQCQEAPKGSRFHFRLNHGHKPVIVPATK